MKTSFSFILSILLFVSIEPIVQVNAKCWDHSNPLKPWEKSESECGSQETKNNLSGLDNNSTASVLAPDEAFQINFTCGVKDPGLCTKAENAFKGAGKTIAELIKFNVPLTVNATFANFCEALGECGGKILGAAGAARTIPLLDDDNIVRQYPQALTKQFLLNPPPAFGPFDIVAFFNAEADLFFEGDPQIAPNQFDFKYIIMHELIHGLGFASGWNNYFSEQPVALTPDPGFLDQVTALTDPVTYTGFEQTAFDKYMVNAKDPKNPASMSDLAVQINGFAPIDTKFPDVQNLLDTFAKSTQFDVAKGLILDSQTPQTFAFRPQNAKNTDDLIFLETTIPFQQGSSISHMDSQTFTGSIDFLEVFNAVRGKSLDEIQAASGGKFPIGPKLQLVLETLGYTTDNNPTPYQPKLADAAKFDTPPQEPLPAGSAKAASSPSNPADQFNQTSTATTLTSSFNILTIIIVVAVTLLF